MSGLGVYIHIPFCKAKCHYCDFTSFAKKDGQAAMYKNALIQEIRQCEVLQTETVSTVFFGGGTPTVLPVPFLAEILTALAKRPFAPHTEITVETNPGTINRETLAGLRQMGINRLSIGLQAWQNHLLARLGRIHTREDFLRNLEEAVQVGFDNISVDLMFALPTQTLDDWHETLHRVTALPVSHISAYGLTVAEDTLFGQQHQAGELSLPNEETEQAMADATTAILAQNGYDRYEISNFAKKGRLSQSRHNTRYWTREPVIGFGLGSHSFYNNRRFANTCELQAYLQANGDPRRIRKEDQLVTQAQAMEEFMFLGLRMMQGVCPNRFHQLFGQALFAVYREPIAKHTRLGFLTVKNGRVALTEQGVRVSNVIFADFL